MGAADSSHSREIVRPVNGPGAETTRDPWTASGLSYTGEDGFPALLLRFWPIIAGIVQPIMTKPDGHARWVRVSHAILGASILTLVFSGFMILLAHPRLYWGKAGNDLMPALIEFPFGARYPGTTWEPAVPFSRPPEHRSRRAAPLSRSIRTAGPAACTSRRLVAGRAGPYLSCRWDCARPSSQAHRARDDTPGAARPLAGHRRSPAPADSAGNGRSAVRRAAANRLLDRHLRRVAGHRGDRSRRCLRR